MVSPHERWREFAESLRSHSLSEHVRPVILESWNRSRAAGVRRYSDKPLLRRISPTELEERQQINRTLIQVGGPLLQDFSAGHTEIRHVVYLTDRDGIVLHSIGYDIWRAVYGLMPGFD